MLSDLIVGSIVSGLVGLIWWDIRGCKRYFEGELTAIKKNQTSALYHADGSPIYVSRADCDRNRHACPSYSDTHWKELRVALEKREQQWADTREHLLLAITTLQAKVDLLLSNGLKIQDQNNNKGGR